MMDLSITPKKSGKTLPYLYEKTKADARERKRNILLLIHNFLLENKLYETLETLEREAQLDSEHQMCENIDLDIILQEYQSYYYTKFQKYPKFLRKTEAVALPKSIKKRNSSSSSTGLKTMKKDKDKDNDIGRSETEEFPFEITSLSKEKYTEEITGEKSLYCPENNSNEWKEMADEIMKEFVPKHLHNSTWKDCIGLTNAAERLKEATIYPLLYPDLFKNVPTWKGVLLFGPPGTGKTLLAKALAKDVSTFVNVTSSGFVSKWRGDSEKRIKVLFNLAKKFAPTTIFIDEIDALTATPEATQHEASRRFRCELLVQIDGILGSNSNIFILGSTNRPWCLDTAILRRFEKRILVPLPDEQSRSDLIKHYLRHPNDLQEHNFECLSKSTENFSGSDIKTLCKEVTMTCVREKISEIGNKGSNKTQMTLRNVTVKDVQRALAKVRPCTSEAESKKYFEWNEKFGSG